MLDISRHSTVYESVVGTVGALAMTPACRPLLLEADSGGIRLATLLLNLRNTIDVYLEKVLLDKQQQPPVPPADVTTANSSASTNVTLASLEMPPAYAGYICIIYYVMEHTVVVYLIFTA